MKDKTVKILIAEDVRSLAETYATYLADEMHEVQIAATGQEALTALSQAPPMVAVLDVNLPDISGLDILKKIKSECLPVEVIVITGKASVNLAVEAMKEGAFDFVMKPLSAERMRVTVRNAIERRRLTNEIAEFQDAFGRDGFVDFMGNSLAMQAIYRILQSAAPTNATVFITGESGTGKELAATTIHKLSKRRNGPFVAINCAAIPKDLLESEIFGHVKGAFTGATTDRKGAASAAHNGTLFLDEIAEMDISLQSKMLRFLQEKSVQRVGEDTARPVDVRIVCATNRDPLGEVAAGRFREDLFYRLHVVPVELPPLRDRDDDVVLIARHFLIKFAQEDGKAFRGFTADAEEILLRYHWPGNVRQLQNVMRSIVVLNDGEQVTAAMLPPELTRQGRSASLVRPTEVSPEPVKPSSKSSSETIRPLDDVICHAIESAIAQSDGSIPRAAAALRVSPSTLYRRIQGWETDATTATTHE